MSWVPYILSQRVNAIIVFAGAFLIMGAIQLTALLPEKYYFRFSNLVSSESSPFMVDPPGVTYTKLCELIRKNRLEKPAFAATLNCYDVGTTDQPSYGSMHEEAIYRAVYTSDEAIRRWLVQADSQFALTPLSQDEVASIIDDSGSLGEALSEITTRYREQVYENFKSELESHLASRFASLPDQQVQHDQPSTATGVDDESRKILLTSHAAIISRLTAPTDGNVSPITKADIDALILYTYSRDSVISSVAHYYVEQLTDRYEAVVKAAMQQGGIDPGADARKVDQAMLTAGLGNYIIAVLVRIAPVLIFGLIIGIFFGPPEVASAAIASALAALLLAWPVILMWDRLVSYEWQDRRALFLTFYVLYILSFYATGRLGAILGVKLRGRVPHSWHIHSEPAAAPEPAMGYSIARDLMLFIVTNATLYVANVFASNLSA
jgi:hypothetical protein